MIKKILEQLGIIKSDNKRMEEYLDELNIPFRNHNTQIDGLTTSLVSIGKNFISAPGSYIITHDSSLILKEGKLVIGKIEIGDNVFVGVNSVILYGSTIGDNCIVGAGSVVKGEFGSNLVIAGNPAKVICTIKEYNAKLEEKDVIKIPEHILKTLREKKLTFKERRVIDKIANDYYVT